MSAPHAGSRPAISFDHAPSFRLVIAHFLAGAGCAAAGGILLALGLGDVHDPLRPDSLAIMHLWAAGWLSLTAIGVLIQFLPVTSGTHLLSPRLAWIHLVLHVSGLGGLVASFLAGRMDSLAAALAGATLWTGFALAVVNLGGTLLRLRQLTVWRVGALLALGHAVVTPTLGWTLLTLLGGDFIVQHHLALLVVHVHLGLGGWMFGLVVAVGGRLLPMFVVAPEPRPWQVGVALAGLQAGLLALIAGVGWPAGGSVGAVLLAGAVAWWMAVMFGGFRRRKKSRPDFPLGIAWFALGLLGLVLAAGIAARLRPGLDGWGTYGILAVGAGGIMINGLLFRIVPFLVRLHGVKAAAVKGAPPPLRGQLEAIPYRPQIFLLAAGVLLLAASTLTAAPALERLARMAVGLGTSAFALNLGNLVRRRATPQAKPRAAPVPAGS